MDNNKLKILQSIDYKIPLVCSLCLHGIFQQNSWGTCNLYEYNHLKHTGEPRNVSIHKLGSCSSYEMNNLEVTKLGSFVQFLTKEHNG